MTATDAPDELLVEAATRLFFETSTFEVVQAAEEAGWAPDVWDAVAEAGFAWIGIDEAAGGSGGSLADACEVLRIAGAHAAPIPLAETGILGGWLLAGAGLPLPDGPVTVAPGRPDDALLESVADDGSVLLRGTLHRVPWAARADAVALMVEGPDGPLVASVPTEVLTIDHVANMAGEPRETVHLSDVVVPADAVAPAADGVTREVMRQRGALSRVMLMAGALEAMSELTVQYTNERQQFGRPIARFQAVQQHLVWGAQDAALAKMAAQVAARQASRGHGSFEIAAAKTLADETATTATRWAHQAHGAMGMTQEYALHHLSRRLWSWKAEYSSPGEWSGLVGQYAEELGADQLYPLITGGSALLEA